MRDKHYRSAGSTREKATPLNHRKQSQGYFIRFIQGLSKQSKCSVSRILDFRRPFEKATILNSCRTRKPGQGGLMRNKHRRSAG
ncbi:MAG: hypothetical protein KIC74_03885, partial [Neisseria sp.]|nr:hypothetical protein [Neisseria sp.]